MSKANKPRRKTYAHRNRARPAPSPAALQRLAEAIAAAPESHLSHDECSSLLEYYVDSEQRGEDAATLYPAIAQHLQTCERCRAILRLLKEPAERAVRETGPVYGDDTPPLPFLPQPDEGKAWRIQIHSSIAGGPLGLVFVIPGAYTREALAPLLAPATPSTPAGPANILLLSDTVPLGPRQVMAEVRVSKSQVAEHIQIDISLAASPLLPEPVQTTLHIHSQNWRAIAHAGQCSFDAIPFSALTEANEILIAFKAGVDNEESDRWQQIMFNK